MQTKQKTLELEPNEAYLVIFESKTNKVGDEANAVEEHLVVWEHPRLTSTMLERQILDLVLHGPSTTVCMHRSTQNIDIYSGLEPLPAPPPLLWIVPTSHSKVHYRH